MRANLGMIHALFLVGICCLEPIAFGQGDITDGAKLKALRNQLEWSIKAQALLGLYLAVALVGFYAFGYRPQSIRLAELSEPPLS